MKTLYFSLIILFVSSSTFGQTQWSDCLSPTGGTEFGMRSYNQKIRDIIFRDFSDNQLLRYQVGETFWVIDWDIAASTPNKYTITHLKPSERIWHSKSDINEIRVITVSKQIEEQDYKLIDDLFEEALNSVSTTCANMGIDGTTSIFSNSRLSGKIWGAGRSNKTKKERMVQICLQINDQIVDKKGAFLKLPKKLKSEIISLTNDFKKFNAEKRSFWN